MRRNSTGLIVKIVIAVLTFSPAVALPERSFAENWGPGMDGFVEKPEERGVLGKDDAKEAGKDAEKTAKLPFDLKTRVQARFDTGDLLAGPNGTYERESDLFLRRARLEMDKKFEDLPFGKELDLNMTLSADRSGQDLRGGEREEQGNDVELEYLYADWKFDDEIALKIGKHKLPFSRISLTSSSRQLLIERPASTERAKDALGSYGQPQIQVHGDFAGGLVRYYAAYGDGTGDLDTLQDLDGDAAGLQQKAWGNAYLGRVEISPVLEKKKDDTGMGEENHVTLGVNAGMQKSIKYSTESIADAGLRSSIIGADFAARSGTETLGTLTAQVEYVKIRVNFSYKGNGEPEGYYAQLGYLLPGRVLQGKLEPAARFEIFDHGAIGNSGSRGTDEKTWTAGFNHYLSKHGLKWSYNFVRTKFDAGVAEAINDTTRKVHQVMMQVYF